MDQASDLKFSTNELMDEFARMAPAPVVEFLPDDVARDVAQKVVELVSAEIDKQSGNPRAALLATSAALLSLTIQGVGLTDNLSKVLSIQDGVLQYGARALKREAFMIGGWVLFLCGAVAHFAGWL